MAARKAPWCDEGWFGSAAYHVATEGRQIVPSLEGAPDDPKFIGSDRHIFWITPLYMVWEGGLARIFGFSLWLLRAYSLLWGLAAVVVWALIVRRLTGSDSAALWALLLLAADHTFLVKATDIRMDAMSGALGALAVLGYLRYRERSVALALFVSQSFAVASFLTHPNGGFLAFLDTAALVLLYDRRRIRLSHLIPAGLPYLMGGLGWGLYLMQDLGLARVQFSGNANGRLSGILAPVSAFASEIRRRYLDGFGWSAGAGKLEHLKILILGGYAAGVVTVARRWKLAPALLLMTSIHFFFLVFLEATKQGAYLVHLMPLLAALLAVAVDHYWTKHPSRRMLVAAAVAAFVALQLAGTANTIVRNRPQRDYLAATAFLQAHTTPGELIVGPTELGFRLGFDRPLSDDIRLGYYTHKAPRYVVVNNMYRSWFEEFRLRQPALSAYVNDVLNSSRPIFRNDSFEIYERAGAFSASMPVSGWTRTRNTSPEMPRH